MSLASSPLHLLDLFLKKEFLPKTKQNGEIVGFRIGTTFIPNASQEDVYFEF